MKKLLVILMIATGCAKEVTQPSEVTETVTYHQGRGEWALPTDTTTPPPPPVDTLYLCCQYYDPIEPRLYRCWTANGDCTMCDSICHDWYGGNFKNKIDDSGKRTE